MAIQRESSAKGAPHEKGASHEKAAPHEKEQHGAKRERTRHAPGGETEQLIFTLNAATGAVLSIEKIDLDGKRHEVAKEETIALAGKGNLHEIEVALDEAFEAGISSVLEPTSEDQPQDETEEHGETEEETELRRVLLTHIIGRDVRRRLQHRLVQRLLLSRTLAH